MKQFRINCMFTEDGIKALDTLRAKLQPQSTKPLSRPDIIRIAVEEMVKQRLK